MRRSLAIAILLGSGCTQTPLPENTPPGTTTEPGIGEPISGQQVLQGIQIGEGGDVLPCDVVLDEAVGVEALFEGLEGSWSGQATTVADRVGVADVSVALSSTWTLSWASYGTGTSFDCEAEPSRTVAGLWLTVEGDDLQFEVAVFAGVLDAPATDFVGEASGSDLGLDGASYDLHGRRSGEDLLVDIYDDLLYGSPIGAIGP